ncbi:apelin [Engraulis encrasicolus]|uniref:apelin n=1 Tax=Engraulis encrasicolus TaxID=184585 RepID=UPI002FD194E7
MNVKILTLVMVLVLSLLCSARAGPMASTEHSKGVEEAGTAAQQQNPAVQQNPARGGRSQRPGLKRRRPRPLRPRLSHKGPMPF